MSPPRHTPKPKLLLDEGFPPRKSFSMLNKYCDIKHVAHDLKRSGAADEEVYTRACETERILVTFNIRDFRPPIPPEGMSIIGVSQNMTPLDIDKKLTHFVKRELKMADYRDKFFQITGETKRKK